MVVNSFRGHACDISKVLLANKCDMVVNPGGMTFQIQPLEVCINKLFQGQGQVPIQQLDARRQSHALSHQSPEACIAVTAWGVDFWRLVHYSKQHSRSHTARMCHIKHTR